MIPATLSANALQVLKARYLRRQSDDSFESFEDLIRRVARAIARDAAREERYFERMRALEFLPNSPTLFNAGTEGALLAACFVLPVDDALDSIFDSLKLMARIQHLGGGTGFSFSRLRPRGDAVAAMDQTAAGPLGFLEIFDVATQNIKQGGRRRGANMGILRVDHPDIEAFIDCKRDGTRFENFNLSVGITDEFMECVVQKRPFALKHPKTGHKACEVLATDLFEQIAHAAWESGDPGVVFLDAINRAHPVTDQGLIEATNPCGEVPLLPNEACNLGSLNLARFLTKEDQGIDWDRLKAAVADGVRFLDDTIDAATFPSPDIDRVVKGNRKIGLGVMGFADTLIRLKIKYDSDEAVTLAEEIMHSIRVQADDESLRLGQEKGPYAHWKTSREKKPYRNATRVSIAPTGTLSIIAGTTAGIEPLFATTFVRENILGGQSQTETMPISKENLPFVRTALEIAPIWHLKIQAAFQGFVDNAVSKTINLPQEATAQDVRTIYAEAWRRGLKGVTVYRYGCKPMQVLSLAEHATRCGPSGCPTV
ncbi:MAG: adenosylcobalamin-dependent ribonucleoside-diphosphate reductase [Deltaproteobacteria bacterium]|nr:adenosylcobalamin-dependent ribonucleoside-diphosphate reductase [Deltaproteobacteria bacterium]MBI3295622.1 adenosylcobalamin-dependent ribonucleoside-diphosphate reductase [Deltaproteobacteria bacterium]